MVQEKINMEFTIENVEEVLKDVRPYLQMDGGDIEINRILDNGILEVKLTGSCRNCPLSMVTLRAGIERALMERIPAIKRIEAVK